LQLVTPSSQPTHPEFAPRSREETLRKYEEDLRMTTSKTGHCAERAKLKILSLKDIYQGLDAMDSFEDLCDGFLKDYYQESISELKLKNPFDKRINLGDFHFAAAMNDVQAVQIGLLGCRLVNDVRLDEDQRRVVDQSPLHCCVFYNDNAKAMIELLVKSGARIEGYGHDCPLHVATARDRFDNLRCLAQCFPHTFQELRQDLFQLALRCLSRKVIKYFINLGEAVEWRGEICESQILLPDTPTSIKPLATALDQMWIEEATMILKSRIEHSTHFSSQEFVFQSADSRNEEMRRLLTQWIDTYSAWKDENDWCALWWSTNLGHLTLIQRIFNKTLDVEFLRIQAAIITASRRNSAAMDLLFESSSAFSAPESISLLILADTRQRKTILPPLLAKANRHGQKAVVMAVLADVGDVWNEEFHLVLKGAAAHDLDLVMEGLISKINTPLDGEPAYRGVLGPDTFPKSIIESQINASDVLEILKWTEKKEYDRLTNALLYPIYRNHLRKHPRLREHPWDPWSAPKGMEAHSLLSQHCIRLMSKLKKDLCALEDPKTLLKDISFDRVTQCLPTEVQYACKFWVKHLLRADDLLDDNGPVHEFLRIHLLHWFEAISFMRNVDGAMMILTDLKAMVVSNFHRIFI
jgi:hypothetical protein